MIAQRRAALALRLRERLVVGSVVGVGQCTNTEADFPLRRAELDDLHLVALLDFQIDLLAALRIVELTHVNQAFDAFVELDERAEVGHADHLAFNGAAHLVPGEEVFPDVGGELLEAERQALVLGVDAEHHRLDDITLLEHFARVLDALAPRHVRDVDQAVDVFFDFHERTELGQVTDLALDLRANRVLLGQLVPRVALDLLQAERDAARRGIHAEHHGVNRIPHVEDLRRVLHALAPRHFAHVDQAFNARLQLDERAVVGQAHHLAGHAGASREAIHHRGPRVSHQLLVAERDALGGLVVLEHHHVDLVVDLEQLRRVTDAAPRHVGDVQQAVDAAEVDERTVVGDVLDHATEDLALGERLERRLLLLGVLLFEEDLAGEHDIAALLVDLDDAHAQFLTLEGVQVAHRANVDLAAGQERADADVHRETTLDPLDDAADDDLPFLEGAFNFVPNLHLLGFFAREDDVAFTVFGALEQHVNDVALANNDLAGFVEELFDGDDAFRLVADVDYDFVCGDLENGPLDDFTFREVAEAVIVKVQQAGILLWVGVIVVPPG